MKLIARHKRKLDTEVIGVLREDEGWWSVPELADDMSASESAVRSTLHGLLDAGLVRRKRDTSPGCMEPVWFYRIAEIHAAA